MTRCWDESVDERPSMEYVVEVMQILCEFFPNGDEPLDYRILDEVIMTLVDINTLENSYFKLFF